MGRILAFDIGTVRTGAAVSDELGITVNPLRYIESGSRKEIVRQIVNMINEHSPHAVVLGLPINLDGSQSAMSDKVRKIARDLQMKVDTEVILMDERLSSKEAENILIGADLRRDRRKEVIDSMAAAIILQKYLERKNFQKIDKENS